MGNNLLLYGNPAPYALQALRKLGSVEIASGNPDWRAYSWVGVIGEAELPEPFQNFAIEVLRSGQTFGVLDATPEQLKNLAGLTGVHPSGEVTGLIVSPWIDGFGVRQFKQIYFHKISDLADEVLEAKGKAPNLLKFLFLKNAMRMHAEAMRERYHDGESHIMMERGQSVVPVQKRPVTFHIAKIHQMDGHQFFHSGDLLICPPDQVGNCEVHFTHRLEQFTHPLFRNFSESELRHEPEPAFLQRRFQQRLKYLIQVRPLLQRPFQGARCQPLHAAFLSSSQNWQGRARPAQKPPGFDVEIEGLHPEQGIQPPISFCTSFVWHRGEKKRGVLPCLSFRIDFSVRASQQFDSKEVSAAGEMVQPGPETIYKGNTFLHTENLDPDIGKLRRVLQAGIVHSQTFTPTNTSV